LGVWRWDPVAALGRGRHPNIGLMGQSEFQKIFGTKLTVIVIVEWFSFTPSDTWIPVVRVEKLKMLSLIPSRGNRGK
jgi:hypothetical protein